MKVFRILQGRSSGVRVAVVSCSAALLLSSCTQNPPGIAADIDGSRISDSEVDEFALVLCSLNAAPDPADPAAAAPVTASKAIRAQALSLLLGIETSDQIADFSTADKAQVASAVTQAEATREQVPEDLREVFDDLVKQYAVSQLALTTLGQASLAEQGDTTADEAAAFAEGERLRSEYTKTADITIDPRFGSLVDGVFTPSTGSLSVPVSQQAKDAEAVPPSEAFVATLPLSQTCS